MKHKLFALICLFLLTSTFLNAGTGMDDFFRSTGKIYTVLAVMLITFGVFIFFLMRLDGKLNKLEKHLNNNE